MLLAGRHVGDRERHFCRARGGQRQASALHGGKMAAHRVYRFDGRAAGNQCVIRRLQIFQSHSRNDGQFGQSRTAARKKKENHAAFVGSAQEREARFRRAPTVCIWIGMAGNKILQTRNGHCRFRGSCHNSLELTIVRNQGAQAGRHGVRRFSNRYDIHRRESREVNRRVFERQNGTRQRQLQFHHA